MKKKLALILAAVLVMTCVIIPEPAFAEVEKQEFLTSSTAKSEVEKESAGTVIREGFTLKEESKID